jgi:cell division protein FtsN
MKPVKSRRAAPRKKSGGGTLVGLFLGLVIGVIGAAVVVWYIHKTPPPFVNKSPPTPTAPAPAGASQQPATGAGPLALPGKPGDPIPQNGEKPRFDFYKILPGNTEAIPDPKPADAKANEPKQADGAKGKDEKDTTLKEPIFLQTGSFQSAAEADNQKAKLALMGAEASVQQVMLQEKVWYRVRLGPFRKMEDVNSLRADLAKQGIEANIVKKD